MECREHFVFSWNGGEKSAVVVRLAELYAAVMEGAVESVRPKMMTVTAIMGGGMVSSPLLTLIVIPAIYAWVKGKDLR